MTTLEGVVITELSNYPIAPDQIDATGDFPGIFGKCESEVAAACIMRLCQKNGGWEPFTLGDLKSVTMDKLDKFLVQVGVQCLVRGEFIIRRKRRYYLTEEFIQRCYEYFPMNARATLESHHYIVEK